MKKIIFIFVMSLISIFSYSQEIIYYKPYVERFAYQVNFIDNNITHFPWIYLCCDKDKKNFWLKYRCPGLNVEEITDNEGRSISGRYSINKGKHIYLKLDNDEIITLICDYYYKLHSGYYIGNVDIYNEYDIYSYFLVKPDVFEKLKGHKIVKMRCELKYEVKDMNLKEEIDFNKSINSLNEAYTKKYNEDHNIDELNNNPLKDF